MTKKKVQKKRDGSIRVYKSDYNRYDYQDFPSMNSYMSSIYYDSNTQITEVSSFDFSGGDFGGSGASGDYSTNDSGGYDNSDCGGDGGGGDGGGGD